MKIGSRTNGKVIVVAHKEGYINQCLYWNVTPA